MNVNKRPLNLLFVLILFISVISVGVRVEAKQDFTTQELLADYDQMWEILYESFPSFPWQTRLKESWRPSTLKTVR